jgi:predicted RNA-binding protein YlqC (UPF0109 family)
VLRELVEYLVKSLVDHPKKVEVTEVQTEKSILIEIKVGEDDVGKIIGKHGRIIRAIRLIAKSAALRGGKRISVEVVS